MIPVIRFINHPFPNSCSLLWHPMAPALLSGNVSPCVRLDNSHFLLIVLFYYSWDRLGPSTSPLISLCQYIISFSFTRPSSWPLCSPPCLWWEPQTPLSISPSAERPNFPSDLGWILVVRTSGEVYQELIKVSNWFWLSLQTKYYY